MDVELSQAEKRRRRQWHIDRAKRRRILAEPSLLAVDRMGEPELWRAADFRVDTIRERIELGSDVLAAQAWVDLYALLRELKLRGVQLQLPLEED